ncbi:MAG TPA: cupin domain-containing protein [Gaiellaceae bacterium]|nr:cupin domain-containing protein [Gaiellaceae bacterium]
MDSPFVANVRDLPWMSNEAMGDVCMFDSDRPQFEQVGYSLAVLKPGQRGAQYHRELDNQEDFLVLSGECIAVVEGEEHRLGQWDFVHCPPGTAHTFLAVGDEPCVIFMCGGRHGKRYVFVRDEVALRNGIGVEVETSDQAEAYRELPKWEPGTPAV